MARETKTALAPLHGSRGWRPAGSLLRDLLGGALLLVAWLALWTVTWAAVAGPLSPADPLRRAEAVERAVAGS